MEIKVHSIHFDADRKLIGFIQEKLGKLEHFYSEIIAGEVFLRLDKSDNSKNKVAEIKLLTPGKELFAKKRCRSFEEATDLATEALRRQARRKKGKSLSVLQPS